MNRNRLRARLSLGLTLLLPALLYASALGYLIHKAGWARETISAIEPRYARLLGLRGAAEQIRQSSEAARTGLDRLAYPVDTDTDRAGADLQQRLRTAAQAAGLSIAGSQITSRRPDPNARPARTDIPFEVITVAINLEADLPALHALLRGLDGQRPMILVEGLALQPARGQAGKEGHRLLVQARFSALKEVQ